MNELSPVIWPHTYRFKHFSFYNRCFLLEAPLLILLTNTLISSQFYSSGKYKSFDICIQMISQSIFTLFEMKTKSLHDFLIIFSSFNSDSFLPSYPDIDAHLPLLILFLSMQQLTISFTNIATQVVLLICSVFSHMTRISLVQPLSSPVSVHIQSTLNYR